VGCPHTKDPHLLCAYLHRAALVRMSEVAGVHLQGMAVGAKQLGFSSNWTRKSRELDATLGTVEKITRLTVAKFMADLEIEIGRAKKLQSSLPGSPKTSEPEADMMQVHDPWSAAASHHSASCEVGSGLSSAAPSTAWSSWRPTTRALAADATPPRRPVAASSSVGEDLPVQPPLAPVPTPSATFSSPPCSSDETPLGGAHGLRSHAASAGVGGAPPSQMAMFVGSSAELADMARQLGLVPWPGAVPCPRPAAGFDLHGAPPLVEEGNCCDCSLPGSLPGSSGSVGPAAEGVKMLSHAAWAWEALAHRLLLVRGRCPAASCMNGCGPLSATDTGWQRLASARDLHCEKCPLPCRFVCRSCHFGVCSGCLHEVCDYRDEDDYVVDD
jgi:hypothetical protein